MFIPAMVAAGGAAAVMAEGIGNVQTHLTAMYDAQEATANIFHTTTGEMVGMKSILQQAQTAADPHVYDCSARRSTSSRPTPGGSSPRAPRWWASWTISPRRSRATCQGALGAQAAQPAVRRGGDLTAFGQVLGNVGHALLNFASDMPGLAHVLLGVVDGASKLIEIFSSMPGKIITGYMALEEFNRWGSLVVGGMGRLGLAANALEGSFFTFGSRTIGIMSNVAKVVPMALAAVTSNIGSAMTAYGRLGGKVEEGDGIFARMGEDCRERGHERAELRRRHDRRGGGVPGAGRRPSRHWPRRRTCSWR